MHCNGLTVYTGEISQLFDKVACSTQPRRRPCRRVLLKPVRACPSGRLTPCPSRRGPSSATTATAPAAANVTRPHSACLHSPYLASPGQLRSGGFDGRWLAVDGRLVMAVGRHCVRMYQISKYLARLQAAWMLVVPRGLVTASVCLAGGRHYDGDGGVNQLLVQSDAV